MMELFNQRFFRDKLSFCLLIMSYALIIFSITNLIFVFSRYKESKDMIYKYSNYSKGVIYQMTPLEDVWTKPFFYSLLNKIKTFNSEKKELIVSEYINDESEVTGIVLDFSKNYMDGLDVTYVKNKDIPGVYIGDKVSGVIESSDGRKYIVFNQKMYLVKGVYKNLINSYQNRNIVFPMNTYSDVLFNELINGAYITSLRNQSIEYYIASNESIENDIRSFLLEYEKNENIEVDLQSLEQIDDIYGIGDIQLLGSFIIVFFAIFSSISSFSLWIKRIRNEIIIRRIWGASIFNILINMIKYIFKVIIFSFPVALFFLFVGNQLSDDKIYDIKYILFWFVNSVLFIFFISILLFLYT